MRFSLESVFPHAGGSSYQKHSVNPKRAEKALGSDCALCVAAPGPAAGVTAERRATAASAAASRRRHAQKSFHGAKVHCPKSNVALGG